MTAIDGGIRTTHTGSLPRPAEVIELLAAREHGELSPEREAGFEATIAEATDAVVRRQIETGIDIINDGETGKISYSVYVKDRLTGFGGEAGNEPAADIRDFPTYLDRYLSVNYRRAFSTPACIGPVSYRDAAAIERDLQLMSDALAANGKLPGDAFISAASPGVISHFLKNQYYPSHEAYLEALAEAMKTEYEAIYRAGFTLQIDCPDLAGGRHFQFPDLSLPEWRAIAALHIDALNYATAGIPPERMRMHLCWGNYEGPHHRDVPLRDIVDLILTARPATISFEAANPRHAHEWSVWADIELPDEKSLMPGVIDSTTNYIEHPELVAERLRNFANIVGPDRVIGATDCGLSTFAGLSAVDPEIAWAKLGSLVEGARIASTYFS